VEEAAVDEKWRKAASVFNKSGELKVISIRGFAWQSGEGIERSWTLSKQPPKRPINALG